MTLDILQQRAAMIIEANVDPAMLQNVLLLSMVEQLNDLNQNMQSLSQAVDDFVDEYVGQSR